MARAGQPLDRWQQDAITLMLSTRADGRWACFEYCELVPRQNGKGAVLEARALAGLFLLGERLILWSAHEYKTAMEAFRRVLWLLGNLAVQKINDNLYDLGAGVLVKVINTNGEESLERLDTGQRLRFVARSKGSGRGFSADCNIIDEAFAFTAVQQAALMPTLSARPNPQIVYTSSPPLDGESGEVLFGLRARAEAGGDDSLGYRDWGLAGDLDFLDGVDLDDLAVWAAANPALGIRIGAEAIQRERRSMSIVDFARERLGIWPRQTSETGVIDPDAWAALADPQSRRVDAIAFAIAINQDRSYAAIAAAGPRADTLMHWEVIDHRPGTAWLVARVLELQKRHDPVAWGIDGRGPAANIITELAKRGVGEPANRDKPKPGDLAVTSAVDMASAFAMFVDTVAHKQARHRDQAQLNAALAGAKTRVIGDGAEAWGRKGSADISPLEAVTLAHWAYETRAHLITADAPPNVW